MAYREMFTADNIDCISVAYIAWSLIVVKYDYVFKYMRLTLKNLLTYYVLC